MGCGRPEELLPTSLRPHLLKVYCILHSVVGALAEVLYYIWPSEQLLQEYYYIINAFRKTDIPWTAIMLNSSDSTSNFLFILQTLPLLPPQITMLLTMHLQRIATQITLLDWYFLCTQLFQGMLVCCFLLSLLAWLNRAQHENQNSALVSFINQLCSLKTQKRRVWPLV